MLLPQFLHKQVLPPHLACDALVSGSVPGVWQVIQRAKEMWAGDVHWSTLSYRMDFAEGDFFKAGTERPCLGCLGTMVDL